MGTRLTDASDVRQKLYGFLNWAVQRGHLKPIYSPACEPSGGAEG